MKSTRTNVTFAFAAAALSAIFGLCAAELPAAKAKPFALDRVRVTGGVFKEKIDIDKEYLLDFMDVGRTDRLLAEFRRVAGLPEKAKRYQGRWEGGGINGHSLGHYLTALSACYAATGDARAKERADYIVDELAECQKANGDGYVMTIPQAAVWDKVRSGDFSARGFDICNWWVPNYTIHKVFAGLRDAYRWTGNKKALEVERGLGDWYAKMIENLSDEQMQRLMASEWGGLNETFADLYADTGDRKFLKVAHERFNDRRIFDPLRRGEDCLDGKHANTQMPKITGLAAIYEMTGDESLRKAVETYWASVAGKRTLANGGHSDHEHFYPVNEHSRHLGPQTFETCNINNMHRLSSHLFCWEPSSSIGDFVERSLINQLVANIGFKPGEFGYFMSTRPVATKVFSTPEGAWWCCVGTGMENPMRYGEQAYFHDDNGLWVNLYMPSTLDWKEKGVKIIQSTNFPDSEYVPIEIKAEKPTEFELRLRAPQWCANPEVSVNGKRRGAKRSAAGYLTLSSKWKTGDRIVLRLPMSLRAEPLPGDGSAYTAFMYGPLLLVGVNKPEGGVDDPAKKRWDDHLAAPAGTNERAMSVVADSLADAVKSIKMTYPKAGKGNVPAFRTDGLLKPHDLSLVPYHRVYEEHYTMYFPVLTKKEWSERAAELERQARDAARKAEMTVDQVEPGFQQSEVNHDYAGRNDEAGEWGGRKYRHTSGRNGMIGYVMSVDGKRANTLYIETCSRDVGRTCDLFVDDTKVDTIVLTPPAGTPLFYELSFELPSSLTKGKDKVKVEIRGNEKSAWLPALYGLRIERR